MPDPTALAVRILMTSGEWIEMTTAGDDYRKLVYAVDFPGTQPSWCGLDIDSGDVTVLRTAQVAAVRSNKPRKD